MRRLVLSLPILASCATASPAVGPALELPAESESAVLPPAAALPGPAVESLGDGFWASSFPTMGTEVQLVLAAPDEVAARKAVRACRAELQRLDALMSEWRADSPISAVNAAAGKAPVAVPDELYSLIERSLQAAERSGGAFDPTWAGMRGVWKFGDAMDGEVPSDAAISAAKARVDWRRVRLDPEKRTVFLEGEGMALGLGGIAKGYAVDRLAALLREEGLRDFVIRLGGDLYASGTHGERPWHAGIQDPRAEGQVFARIDLRDAAFSTSGDYERFFVKDGVRYHHIIDPATGRPATASRSVTALCPDALTAEVVTKPVFILGPEKGIPYAKRQGCEVAIVDAKNVVHLSPGLEGRLEWTQPTP